MSRRTIVSIIVLSLLPCAAARASDQVYTFRQNYRDGQQFNVLFSQNMELTYRGTYNGNVIGTFRHVDAMQNKGLLSVLKTSDGLPVSERIELDPASGEFTQSSGEANADSAVHKRGRRTHSHRELRLCEALPTFLPKHRRSCPLSLLHHLSRAQ